MRYTKKPVTIEAIRFIGLTDFGDPQFDASDGMPEWLMEALSAPEGDAGSVWTTHGHGDNRWLTIGTLEGAMTVGGGDWIIQGIKGELYPCKPDIFEATYGPASIPPEIVKVAKEARRSLLLDMQSECIQLRVALSKARDQFAFYAAEHQAKADSPTVHYKDAEKSKAKAETNRQFAAMCQTAIDSRPATGSTEALTSALAETSVEHPSDLPNGSVDRLRDAAKPFVIGHGFSDTVGDSDGDDGA